MLPKRLAFIDVETTGGSHTRDRIIDIGILRVEDGQLVDTYQSLINPQSFVPDYISSMTGITTAMLWDAPSFGNVKEEISEILDGCVFVAHNVRFDYSFVKAEFKRLGLNFSFPQLCTVKLSRALFPKYKHHNLDEIISRFNLVVENRHRAFDDARALWDFYQIVSTNFPVEKLIEEENRISKKITTPINISQSQLDSLSEGPGVYIFYDEKGTPLYVGKSVNIKDRVLSHFRADIDNPKEMRLSQGVHSIETIETNGELGALLKEASLIKELLPLHNRMLRRLNKMYLVKRAVKNGLESAEIELADQIEASQVNTILGVFKTKRAAQDYLSEFVEKHSLCKKVLGLENGSGFCFYYHLEKCRGICGGKENPLLYNLRAQTAFSENTFKKWPFDGPIGIKEEDSLTGRGQIFVIDKWCFLGSIKYDENYSDELVNDYNFDYDTYKILAKYLFNTAKKPNLVFFNSQQTHLSRDIIRSN